MHLKLFRRSVAISLLVGLGVVLASPRAQSQPTGANMGTIPPATARTIIQARARNVLSALSLPHMNRLASYVHPTRGLRFSPYISPDSADRVFSRSRVRHLGGTRLYNWGSYDGSGGPIRLSWRNYYHQFVYNRNFLAAPQVYYNTRFARGNTINTLETTYPNAIYVEYHFPASTSGGLDWSSLWLVFQKRGSTWYLSGIAHDQWTI